MRVVIDMQGAQSTGNWNRGIGRYSLSLALALARNCGKHEIYLALNGAFAESVERIRSAFEGVLPQQRLRVWSAPTPTLQDASSNDSRRDTAELLREAFLASLMPDIVLVSSLFEGLGDESVTSVKRLTARQLTAVVLYDLIPYLHPKPYLENPVVLNWYLEKIEHLKKADLWLGISESSTQEGIVHLALAPNRSVAISTAADDHFRPIDLPAEVEKRVRNAYQLPAGFVMYTGGIDHRKNIEGLIRAYALLPSSLRQSHKLAIVCAVQDHSRATLNTLAAEVGLSNSELVLTGFVPDEDLVALYNLCSVFVFPSWHEGFGLPALEAMRCGAPVIAANTSSLPEVVGLASALFDPHSDAAISAAIAHVLTDTAFRQQLIEHGSMQASKFSWDATATRALAALEQCVLKQSQTIQQAKTKLKLAYISPLPPERSGISDYSAELLPALADHYDIEVVVDQLQVSDSWIKKNCPIRTVQWFIENSEQYDRVLYHFGNSAFHQHMFGLLKEFPGVVVLHDFFLSGVTNYMDATGFEPGSFDRHLFESHGYGGLKSRVHAKDVADVIWKYPANLAVLTDSMGVIVHSANSLRLAHHWFADINQRHWAEIPLLRSAATEQHSNLLREKLGFAQEAFIACSFGMLSSTKLNHCLLNAWFESELSHKPNSFLVFVGENQVNQYCDELVDTINRHPRGASVRITGYVDTSVFKSYLAVADIGVQLRSLSRGETSAAVLDCMNHGIATIVNANGSMADLDAAAVLMLPDDFVDNALIKALEALWRDSDRRLEMGRKAKMVIEQHHAPRHCALKYKEAIEQFYSYPGSDLRFAVSEIAQSLSALENTQLVALSQAMAVSFPVITQSRTLFIDVSELIQHDAKTGIQRVVRNLLLSLLTEPPAGWVVEPVYATEQAAYRYAREFTKTFLGIDNPTLADDPIDFAPGDVFFGLDFSPLIQACQADFFQQLRRYGVAVKFMVYDLLCIKRPHHFFDGAAVGFARWLNTVAECDGAVCISNSVATDLSDWMHEKVWQRRRSFSTGFVHLGVEKIDTVHLKNLPIRGEACFNAVNKGPVFLMVGTLEPRKGHAQVLDALEKLWRNKVAVSLVIIGKQGWMVDELVNRISSHAELDKSLFWLHNVSNDYLEQIYAASTCLIAASYDEGFGLPLIEAAQHRLPIISRDIPVFREVAGDNAFYFKADRPEQLVQALEDWLTLHKSNQHPRSDNLPWLTWKQSAAQLLKALNLPAPLDTTIVHTKVTSP